MSLEDARYAQMRWNTPLSNDHAALLLERLDVGSVDSILDLGCGWGELLGRAVSASATARGVGVDRDRDLLDRARMIAERRGLAGRIEFIEDDAGTWTETADRVISVGAAHAFGGAAGAFGALARNVSPGGRLLFGDGCWERPPTAAALAMFGDTVRPLSEVLSHAGAAGWRLIHLSTADQREWDEFESTWRAGRQEWLLAHPDDPQAAALRGELDEQLADYVNTYRSVLGFCYLVVARV